MQTPMLLPDNYDAPKAALALAVELAKTQAVQAYPDEVKRIARAGTLVLDGAVTLHDTHATVHSGSSEKAYQVNGKCQCKASEIHGEDYRCAHRWAKSLLKRAAQHLDNLWFATYDDIPGMIYETSKDLWAFFMAGTEGYTLVPMASALLVVCGHCPEVIAQAQQDALLAQRRGN